MAYCLVGASPLRLLTSIQRQHRPYEYLQDYMVDSSSNVMLLILTRVGFLRQFSANWALTGEVIFLYEVVALLVSRGLGPSH
jgi:hypothetical protein